jgi:hypothetical protein
MSAVRLMRGRVGVVGETVHTRARALHTAHFTQTSSGGQIPPGYDSLMGLVESYSHVLTPWDKLLLPANAAISSSSSSSSSSAGACACACACACARGWAGVVCVSDDEA